MVFARGVVVGSDSASSTANDQHSTQDGTTQYPVAYTAVPTTRAELQRVYQRVYALVFRGGPGTDGPVRLHQTRAQPDDPTRER